jgi:hypothetical protein
VARSAGGDDAQFIELMIVRLDVAPHQQRLGAHGMVGAELHLLLCHGMPRPQAKNVKIQATLSSDLLGPRVL